MKLLGGFLVMALAAGIASAQPNDMFANAEVITGPSGSALGNNTFATKESGEPAHGLPFNSGGASIWYRWTAPTNGLIRFDTANSSIDTLLSVYTGSAVDALTLIAGDDDSGPGLTSLVTFNATNGVEYWIAVDGFNFGVGAEQGQIFLNWNDAAASGNPSGLPTGVFLMATDELRRGTYVFSENEGFAGSTWTPVALRTVPARTTITRVAGSHGRVTMNYTVTNLLYTNIFTTNYYGTNIFMTNVNDVAGTFFTNIYQTNIAVTNLFHNYTYYLPERYHYFPMTFGFFAAETNENGNITTSPPIFAAATNPPAPCADRTFTGPPVITTNADMSITTTFATTNVFCYTDSITEIIPSAIPFSDYVPQSGQVAFDDHQMSSDVFLSVFATGGPHRSRYGFFAPPANRLLQITLSNPALDALESTNLAPPTVDPAFGSALINIMEQDIGGRGNARGRLAFPSNSVINLERATFRIKESDGIARLSAFRTGTNVGGATVGYRINFGPAEDLNNEYPLQPGSDYVTPGADYTQVTGTLTWGANDFDEKNFDIAITNDNLVEFNEDMLIQLFIPQGNTDTDVGGVNTANLTILFEDDVGSEQPAGAVDLTHNMDLSSSTVPPFMATPGANNVVMALLVQPDGRTIIGGDFTGVQTAPRGRIARLNNDGSLDTTFLPSPPNSGANGFVSALGRQNDGKIIAAGNFTSFNGNSRNRIVRLNSNGSVDTAFNPGLGANQTIWALAIQPDGKILIAGEFSTAGTLTRPFIARLNTNGVADATFDPGVGPDGTVNVIALDATGKILIGGEFTSVSGESRVGIARLEPDGALDPGFLPGAGADSSVYALLPVAGGKVLVGGAFNHFDLRERNRIARLNSDGSLDVNFDPGDGADDVIYTMIAQPDGKILLGGLFTRVNDTRRVGIARLFADGAVDTEFMDTAYNQYAGIPNHYHDETAVNPALYPAVNTRNFIFAIGLEPTGNVMIGGGFVRVGGGFTRDDIRNRSNFARLVGNSTPGPGNIEFTYDNYSMDENGFYVYVSLVRTNGNLGTVGATFSVNILPPGPGAAATNDLTHDALTFGLPTWGTSWNITQMRSDGIFGPNFLTSPLITATADVIVNVNNNTNIDGNRTAQFELSDPASVDQFFLGGENIPLGVALGRRFSTLTIVDDDTRPGTLGFSLAGYSVDEGVGNAVITVTRTNGSHGSVTVKYSTVAGGTATTPADYTFVTNTLTFAPGQISRNFTVPIVNDSTIEFDETIHLQLFNPGGGANLGLSNAVLTIVDNDFSAGRLNLSPAYSTNESARFALITVTRTGGNLGTVTAQIGTSNGTAIAGVDYIGVTNTLTWTNGDLSPKTLAVPLNDDNAIEPDKTVNLTLFNATLNSSPEPQVLGGTTTSVLTILNDDQRGLVRFSTVTNLINEHAGLAYITVIRTGGGAEAISVNFSATNGTAVAGFDFTATNGTLNFAPGVVSRTFTVPITDNLFQDGERFISLLLTGITPTNALGSPASAVLNIVDNESVNEPPGSLDTSYSLPAGFNDAVQTLFLQSDGKLLAGGDFTVANGSARRRVARLDVNGKLDTGFSSLIADGVDATVRTIIQQTDGRILIGGDFTNVNTVPRGHIARLNLDGSLNETFDPGFGTDNPVFTLAETFVGGQRKILAGGSFTAANAVSRNGIIRFNEDGSVDTTFGSGLGPNGTVFAVAVYPTNDLHAGKVIIGGEFTTVNGVARNHIARLHPDGSLDLAFDPVAGANDTVRAVAIQLDGRVLIGGSFTNYNGTTMNRFARLNADGSVDPTFTPGVGANDTVSSITVQPDTRIVLGGQFTRCSGVTRNHITRLNNDGTVDPSINFGYGADNYVAAAVVQLDGKIIIGGAFTSYDGLPRARVARIYGGSIAGSGTLEFVSGSFLVNEPATNATVTVRRRGGTAGVPASANITVGALASNGTATNGLHYLGGTTTLTFPPGEVLQSFLIPVIDDFEINADRTAALTLTNIQPASSAALGNQPTAVLTIVNDDSAISFSAPNYSRNENPIDGAATIQIVRAGSTVGAATVNFLTTTNGSATAGVDYVAVSNSIVFAQGETVKQVTVPLLNDGLVEGDETVGLVLTNAGGALLLVPSQATLTIVDDDFAPGRIGFVSAAFNVAENGANAVITLIRTNGRSGVVSVQLSTSDLGATTGLDYTPVSTAVVFGDGETNKSVMIPINDDTQVEGPEVFNVTITNVTGGATILAPHIVPVTILDNDVGLTFSSPVYLAAEAAPSVSVTVLRINGSNGVATVNYTTTNITANVGSDYVLTSGTLTFANGETIKSFTVPILEDTIVEGDETFRVVLSNPSPGAVLLNGNANVSILDNDTGLGFGPAAYVVGEAGTNIMLTVIRTNANTPNPITVTFGTTNGTATAGGDYAGTAGVLTFTNGESLKTITVPILEDTQVEGDEGFTVVLSNPTGGAQFTGPTVASVSVVDNDAGFAFSSDAYTLIEGGVQQTITVLRTGITNSAVSVNFATSDGTATNNIDYLGVSGTLTFTNGEVSKSFTVSVIDDTVEEGTETALLKLSNPTGQAALLNPNAATLTIVDNDGSLFLPAGVLLTAESIAANGAVDVGETITALFAIRSVNPDLPVTSNLIATLLATNGVALTNTVPQNYGSLVSGGASVSRPFTFRANATNGSIIAATFQLRDDASTNLGRVTFNFLLGTSSATFSNLAPITINDSTNNAPVPGTPYPSVINVAGLGGSVSKVVVALTNVAHTNPDDVDILLVSPASRGTILMSDAGGGNQITNVTLTFDDAAVGLLPNATQITTGTNQPSNYLLGDSFPQPALPPTGAPAQYASTLAAFNGSNPNGAWSLFVVDDAALDVGAISRGWYLFLTTSGVIPPAVDLSVTMTASPSPGIVGSNLVYTVLVTNHGPWSATNVVLNNQLPVNAAYVSSSTTNSGTTISTNGGGELIWTIGNLAKDAWVRATITVLPTVAGVVSSTSSATALAADPNLENSTVTVNTIVASPTADLLLGMVDEPSPVFLGGNLTYSLSVTNNGPATATAVSVTNTLPPGMSFVSASPAGYTRVGNVVTFTNLGDLGSGVVFAATITVRPDVVGEFTNTATVASVVIDPFKGNNTAAVKSLVEYPPLNAVVQGNNLVISWPADAASFSLESTTSLAPPVVWTPVTVPPPVTVGGQRFVTNAIGAGDRFFRLRATLP